MSGKMSRRKGSRVEYLVRDYFRMLGYNAERVPLSGASSAMKGDVRVTRGQEEFLVEVKARSDSFDRLYELYFHHIAVHKDDLMQVNVGAHCISVSTSFEAIKQTGGIYPLYEHLPTYKAYKRTYQKLEHMHSLLGQAKILVLKGDRKPLLFVRYA